MKPYTRRELFVYLERIEPVLRSLSHFDVLDVPLSASSARIQRAFHVLAERVHPDQHRSHLNRAEFERVTRVYARIAEAYRVLKDQTLRSSYIRRLGATRTGHGAASQQPQSPADAKAVLLDPRAQRLYRRAQAALRTGDRKSAVLNLRLALARNPDSELLREALNAAERPK